MTRIHYSDQTSRAFNTGIAVIGGLLLAIFLTSCTSALTRIENKSVTSTNGVVETTTITTERLRTLFSAKTSIVRGRVSQTVKTNGVATQGINVTGFDASSQDPLTNTNLGQIIGSAAKAALGLP